MEGPRSNLYRVSNYETEIAREFETCVRDTLNRLLVQDTERPFHTALLSKDALFWSRFERSFSTSFGQGVIERISRLAALEGGASEAEKQHVSQIDLSESKLSAIDNNIRQLRERNSGLRPNWRRELRQITKIPDAGATQDVRVISDLWWRKDGVDHFMSIKTVKPNIDQTAEAKKDLLKLQVAYPNSKVYFGLYYNPYGSNRSDYAWGPARTIFDCLNDEVVLIGKDYWEALGGVGAYERILEIAEQVGEATREMLLDVRQD